MNIGKTFVFQVLKNQRKNFLYHHARPFFFQSYLKLASFQDRRKNLKNLFLNPNEYKSRLKEYLAADKIRLIFSDDVINMLALTDSDEDLDILKNLLFKINSQEVTFKRFTYGPEIMRLLHVLNKPKSATDLVENDKLFHFFNNQTSCAILLDLLWENQMYHKIIQIFQMYINKSSTARDWFNTNVLFFCACYKENTRKSYHAASIIYDSSAKRVTQNTVIKLFFAALAFKQNHLKESMEILAPIKLNCTSLNTMLLILARNQRFVDVIQNIENMAFGGLPNNFYVCSEVLEIVKKEMMDTDDEAFAKLQQLVEKLPKTFFRDMKYDDLLFTNTHFLMEPLEEKKLVKEATPS